MNKKQFNRIKSLYRDKVSDQVCITSIIEMSNSNFEAATFITKFYNEMIIIPIMEEYKITKAELFQWQDLEKRLNNEMKGITNESPSGEESTNLEDQRPDKV